ncbi:MAG: VOC family protein [Proteobacteria bacterium]|nr:VOC family protein [Pseudomonadota bacterium]
MRHWSGAVPAKMITALDHLTLKASFRTGAIGACETLLGRAAVDGRLQLANVGLRIEDDASTARLGAMVFATGSLEKAERLLGRRGVATERKAEMLVLNTAASHEVPIALVERSGPPAPSPLKDSSEDAAIASLDHVVVRTPNPERAIAFYAGRLGLDLRLDRSNPKWNARLLFFRCGDLVVEIAHDLSKGVSDGPDQLWGVSWRARDIARCHARLKKAGVEVSEPREGRRPGTQVMTVQSHTANVPTIVIGGLEHW